MQSNTLNPPVARRPAVTPATAPHARPRRRWRVYALSAVLVLALLALVVPTVYAANSLTAAVRNKVDPALIATIGGSHQDVSFASRQNLTLKGWLFQAATPTGRSVIMVHGWRQNRVDPGYHTDAIA